MLRRSLETVGLLERVGQVALDRPNPAEPDGARQLERPLVEDLALLASPSGREDPGLRVKGGGHHLEKP